MTNEQRALGSKRGAITRKNRLSLKEAAYAKEIVKTKNGTKAALAVYDTKDYSTAAAISSENLNKPKVREEIERLLNANDVDLPRIVEIHKRNMLQNKHLPTSQKAVGDFYELLGLKTSEKASNNIQVAFVIEK